MTNENNVVISGTISTLPEVNPKYSDVQAIMYISIPRLSNVIDTIPVRLPKDFPCEKLSQNDHVHITGKLITYWRYHATEKKFCLIVDADCITQVDDIQASCNEITLDGYLCKKPIFRTTPRGRLITDLTVAVNASKSVPSYIPCICWGGYAINASEYKIGDHIFLKGRIQSRIYTKQLSPEESEERITYEISVRNIFPIAEEESPQL